MAKTSKAERDYHARRAVALKKYNDAHPKARVKTLRDAGLSLAVNGAPKPKALVEKAKPKRIRKSRAKAKDGQKSGQLSVLTAVIQSTPMTPEQKREAREVEADADGAK